jgi:hypothetical protein
MNHRALPFALACCATLALAACSSAPHEDATTPASDTPVASTPAPAATTAPPTAMQECNADAAQEVVGKTANDEVIEQARQASGATVARALRPDMVVTMEYRADRLNLRTNTDNVVVSVGCG